MKKVSLVILGVLSGILFPGLIKDGTIRWSELRYILIASILILYFYYSETVAHKRREANWENIRIKGKARFIIYDYVLLRGGVISTLIILIISIKASISLLLFCSVIPILVVTAFAGNEVWKQCESDYAITKLKSVAEKIKVRQN